MPIERTIFLLRGARHISLHGPAAYLASTRANGRIWGSLPWQPAKTVKKYRQAQDSNLRAETALDNWLLITQLGNQRIQVKLLNHSDSLSQLWKIFPRVVYIALSLPLKNELKKEIMLFFPKEKHAETHIRTIFTMPLPHNSVERITRDPIDLIRVFWRAFFNPPQLRYFPVHIFWVSAIELIIPAILKPK